MSEEQPQPKKCSNPKCEQPWKTTRDFYKDRGAKDGLKRSCKDCRNAAKRAWIEKNPEQYREQNRRDARVRRLKNPEKVREANRMWYAKNTERARAYSRRYKYGIEPGQFSEAWLRQEGRCAVCDSLLHEGSGINSAHSDHDHTTGNFRAILCGSCNTALGLLEEDPARIRRVATYIHLYQLGHPDPPAVLRNLRRK